MFSQAKYLGIYEELAAYRIGDFVLHEQSVLVDAGTCPMLDQPLPTEINRPARSRDSHLEFTFSYSALIAPCSSEKSVLTLGNVPCVCFQRCYLITSSGIKTESHFQSRRDLQTYARILFPDEGESGMA